MKETANPQLPPGDALSSGGGDKGGRPNDNDCGTMGTDEEDPHRGVSWAVWLVAVPIVYVLSIGPVALITKNHPNQIETLRKVYAPVIWLHNNTFLKRPLEMYIELFGAH